MVLGLILAIGMARTHRDRRWTSQATVDQVNEGHPAIAAAIDETIDRAAFIASDGLVRSGT